MYVRSPFRDSNMFEQHRITLAKAILEGHTSPGRAKCCKPDQTWQDKICGPSHTSDRRRFRQRFKRNCFTRRYIAFNNITLPGISFHHSSLLYPASYYIALHYFTRRYITSHSITLYYFTRHHITSQYMILPGIAVFYQASNYIA